MEFVQPIRNRETIEKLKNELMKTGYRNFLLFTLGINVGLRISDLLKLKVIDVREKSHIVIREIKTGKERRILINSYVSEYLNKYIQNMEDDEYLFKSREGENRPINRTQAYKIINYAAKNIGIKDKIGTHTLRKTFGFHHYKMHKDVALLQQIFQHSSPSITLRYIGINEDIMDKSIEDFCL